MSALDLLRIQPVASAGEIAPGQRSEAFTGEPQVLCWPGQAALPTVSVAVAPSGSAAYFDDYAADDDAIATEFATSTDPVELAAVDLDGAIGASLMYPARPVRVITSAATGAYALDTVTVIGLDADGEALSSPVTLTDADGGEDLETPDAFSQVTSVQISAMADTDGSFLLGTAEPATHAAGASGTLICDLPGLYMLTASTVADGGTQHEIVAFDAGVLDYAPLTVVQRGARAGRVRDSAEVRRMLRSVARNASAAAIASQIEVSPTRADFGLNETTMGPGLFYSHGGE